MLSSQNRWPTLALDVASLLQAGGGFFGAGFYYKTFIWPKWRTYEPLIRRLAGLGAAPGACELPPACVENLSCDVLIAGGGAAGLAAARAAARAGARVVLCEREPVCGGELEFEGGHIEGQAALTWVTATVAELAGRGARILHDTALIGGSGGQLVLHAAPGGAASAAAGASTLYHVRPRSFVVATGAVERPIAFIDNDRPGVMLLGAAERYLARYGVRAGLEAVLFANHDRVYAAAARLAAGGLRIVAIVDSRREAAGAPRAAGSLRADLQKSGTECLVGHAVIATEGGAPGACGTSCAARRGRRHGRCRSSSGVSVAICCCRAEAGRPRFKPSLQEGGAREYSASLGAFLATAQPHGRSLPAPRTAASSSAPCSRRATRRAPKRPATPGYSMRRRAPPAAGRGDDAPQLVPFWRSPAPLPPRETAVRRPAERCDGGGPARGPRRGLHRHRAHQALHDARDRHGAGRDERGARRGAPR